MTRLHRITLSGVGLALLTACSAGSGGKAHPTLTHSPLPDLAGKGTISGRLLAVGGPVGASPSPQHGRVVVRHAGRLVMTIPVPKDGRYRVTIVPGTYWIRGYSPQYDDGRAACRGPHPTVTVHAGETTHVTIYCERR